MALYDPSDKSNLGHALETAMLHALLRSGAGVGYTHTDNGYEVGFYARSRAVNNGWCRCT